MKLDLTLTACIALIVAINAACGSSPSNETTPTTTANTTAANSKTSSTPASTTAPAAARKADISTTAETLYKEYKSDPKSLDKYKGKVVEISGKFDKTGGSESAPEVRFETGDASLWVACIVSPSALQAAAKLQKGQDIKMTGMSDPTSIIGPRFKDCEMSQ